ncbi:MAG: NAD(P)/FAD-dependent oxidoreductase [Planctomycetaceae bacterium]|nr:NAD(P)/FAD-dependent oxidoreductase [Planctomycetaceae bacterium]
MNFDVLIVGAGPAGLMCAISAAKHAARHGNHSIKIAVLEKNAQAAKKLLIAGSGRCNISHAGAICDFLRCYGTHGRFVKPALLNWSNDDLAGFMQSHGLPLVELNDGKLFPVTQSSHDVRRILLDELKRLGIEIRYDSPVEEIGKTPEGFSINPDSKKTLLDSKKMVIATGGKTYPGTGSTGDGYRLAEMLGHTITETAPALAPVTVKNFQWAQCAGLSFDAVPVTVFRNGKKTALRRGDLLVTHHGLSGPVILDLSRDLLPDDALEVSFVPAFPNAIAFEKRLLDDCAANGKKSVKNVIILYGVPERLVTQFFVQNGIAADLTAAELDRETRKRIVAFLAESRLVVERLGGNNEAMVTRGGISLREVNRNDMQSRIVPGLFFCGEVLDVDGDTGGYNLQFAFSSGVLAGQSLA